MLANYYYLIDSVIIRELKCAVNEFEVSPLVFLTTLYHEPITLFIRLSVICVFLVCKTKKIEQKEYNIRYSCCLD